MHGSRWRREEPGTQSAMPCERWRLPPTLHKVVGGLAVGTEQSETLSNERSTGVRCLGRKHVIRRFSAASSY
jgi:hypothetical protein